MNCFKYRSTAQNTYTVCTNDCFSLPLIEDGDGMAINDKFAILHLHVSLELAVGGVVLEHVHHVV